MSINTFPVFFFLIFSVTLPSTFSVSDKLSFNFSDINPERHGEYIKVIGDASISSEGIQVTSDIYSSAQRRVGWAVYREPLHLWDRVSRNLSRFYTHFSFIIKSSDGHLRSADGLSFFLAPLHSVTPDGGGGGSNGGFGLGESSAPPQYPPQSYVAVEFDTYSDDWDPAIGPHVGIDINSTASFAYSPWYTNISAGLQNEAWITYDPTSMNLTVNYTNSGTTPYFRSISSSLDLRKFLPHYVIFGFSASTTISLLETQTVMSWEFSSTLETHSIPVDGTDAGGNKSKTTGLIVALGVGLPLIFLVVFLGCYLWKKCGDGLGDEDFFDTSMDKEFEKGAGPKEFPYRVLARATKKFAESEKLGQGGFGGVYKGCMLSETNCEIAVKRVSKESKQGLKEYQSEIKIISQLKHRHLVQLLGWCHRKRGELLLVYELMPNGSLDSHLFKQKSVLTWDLRYKIVKGLASALLYLHEEGVRCVVHRDIKTSNIMLDSNFDAKLGDFGLARLVDHEKGSQTTIVAGTRGYMAPEYVITGKASKESDVYSFGVVLLEIACGRRPIKHSFPPEEVMMVEWVWSLYSLGRLLEAVDPKLDTIYNEQELEGVLVVGLWCVHPDSSSRPSVRQAIHVLTFDAELPELPCVMPVPTYNVPERSLSSYTHTNTNMSMNMSVTVNSGGYTNLSNKTGSSTASGTGAALLSGM